MDPRNKIFIFIAACLMSLIILSIFMVMTLDPTIDGMGLRV